jgi:hypothetical protein
VFGADVYDDERAKVAARLAAGDEQGLCRFRSPALHSFWRGVCCEVSV